MFEHNSIIPVFEEIVSKYPERIALRFQGQSMTYRELNGKANHLAEILGVNAGDFVGISMERNMDLIIGMLGILKAGAVYVPIDLSYPLDRKKFMIEDAKPRTILTSLPQLEERGNFGVKAGGTDLAYINYTSGSTGRPKGVEVCHQGVVRLAAWLSISPEDTFLQFATVSFDAATLEIWGALLNGATLCIYPEPNLSLDVLEKVLIEVTYMDCTPRIFNLIMDKKPEIFRCLKFLSVGGDVMSPSHAAAFIKKFPNCRLFNGYGPTENTCYTTVYEVTSPPEKSVPIGRPINGTTVYILDKSFQLVPDGEPGELCTGGTGLARGYLNRPELTAEKFIQNPFGPGKLYRTGDLARVLPDGNIEFLGRMDNQIKIRGFRVEPSEIENTLREHPGIDDCVVVAKDEKLTAYCVGNAAVESLRSFAKSKLPNYLCPNFYVVLEELPLSPTGKVDKKALPQNETEEKISKVWAEYFGLEGVGRTDDFFLIGGDSVDAVEMALMMEIPVDWLFEHSTVESLSRKIDQLKPASTSFVEWRQTEAQLPDFPIEGIVAPNQYENPREIFLTGATGFIGAFFLRELLESTEAKIHCLVREPSRLEKVLQKNRIWKEEYRSRIVEVAGDLEKPHFGLEPAHYDKLARTLDTIFHIGAYVNHALPYQKLRAANVLGTEEAIRLASKSRLKPLHFVSTVDVLGSEQIGEEIDIDLCTDLATGYAQSKWVAEKLVMEARRRSLPANIYRLSRVCGDSATGSGPTHDFLWRTIQACLTLKGAPKTDYKEELTPVDYVCKSIAYIASKPDLIDRQFHVLENALYSFEQFFKYLEKLGYHSPLVDFEDWSNRLKKTALETNDKSLKALMTMFPEEEPKTSSYCNQRFKQAISKTAIYCAPICEKLFKKYVDYYVDIGFFEATGNFSS